MIDSLTGQDDEYANALKLNGRMFRNRVGVIATFSSWSGRRVQDTRELSELGIRNTEEYLAHRSKGDKLLIPNERVAMLNAGKTEADNWLTRNFMQVSFLPGVYAVPRDSAKDVRDKLVKIGAEYQVRAQEYCQKPVRDDGRSLYDIDREAMVDLFMIECPGLTRKFFLDQYPSKSKIISKYRAKVFVVPIFSPSMGDSDLDRAQAIMVAAEARELAKEVSFKLRAGIIECLQSFTDILGGKKLDSKINDRTIRSVRGFFEKFRTLNFVADPVLEDAISQVEGKFETASSFTREELEALGINKAVSAAITAASDHASALRAVEDSLDAMLADDWTDAPVQHAQTQETPEPDSYIA